MKRLNIRLFEYKEDPEKVEPLELTEEQINSLTENTSFMDKFLNKLGINLEPAKPEKEEVEVTKSYSEAEINEMIETKAKEAAQLQVTQMAADTKAKAKANAEIEAKIDNVRPEFKDYVKYKVKKNKDLDVAKFLSENTYLTMPLNTDPQFNGNDGGSTTNAYSDAWK